MAFRINGRHKLVPVKGHFPLTAPLQFTLPLSQGLASASVHLQIRSLIDQGAVEIVLENSKRRYCRSTPSGHPPDD
jgi:hypothetical protein